MWASAGAIAVTALTARLLHLWFLRDSPFFTTLMGDARGYDTWAQQIAAGDWIGREVFYQAPLYPYFLAVIYALFGHDLLIVRIVQAIVGSVACVLLGLAAARLFTPRVGLIAGLMLALYAPAVFMDSLIQKSILDVFFICLTIWCVSAIISTGARASRLRQGFGAEEARALWFLLGLALGALSLTRENAIVLIAVVIFWALFFPHPPYPTHPTYHPGRRHDGQWPPG